jgi:hypothetical protein
MPDKELTPLSIRLSEDVIVSLKREARRISFEKDKDVSYVDLIRDAVANYVAAVEPKHNREEVIQSISVESVSEPMVGECTDLDWLRDLNEAEWLSLFGLSFNVHLTQAMQGLIEPILESKSLARAILLREDGKKFAYDRDVCGIIHLISRRGAVPDQIQEGDTFLPCTFQIACNPALKIEEILTRDPNSVAKLATAAGTAIAKEENVNFCALIRSAGSSEIIRVPNLDLVRLCAGYDALVQKGLRPNHLIISPTTFLSLSREARRTKGDYDFRNLQDDNSVVGIFNGAEIRANEHVPANEAYFLAIGTKGCGLVQKVRPSVVVSPEPKALRSGFAIWEEIGLFIHDYMVSALVSPTHS